MATFQKITRANLKTLMPGEKVTERGITFERALNGDGVYSVNVMVDRQRIHRIVGRETDGTTRKQVEIFIEKTRTAAREDRLALPKGRKVALTFKDAATKYVAILRESGGKCVDRKERQFYLHLNSFFGTIPLSRVSTLDVARYSAQRRDRGASAGTVNRELAVVSHLFSKAIEWGWTERRPKVVRLKEDSGRIDYLVPQQCRLIIDAARNDLSQHIYPYIVIALSTAMRMTEILSMKRQHVDSGRKRITIPLAKAGGREQPITSELAKFLTAHIQSLPKEIDWLFPSEKSESGRLATIRKAFRRVVKAAGLNPDLVLRHTLRHTAITHLVQSGVDLPTVQKVSGHKSLAMVGRYAHANGAHIDTAMSKLEDRLELRISDET